MIDSSNLGFTYDGQTFALRDVSVHVDAGEFVCILGGNGSGKSTFAKHINALLTPDEGSMVVDGSDTRDQQAIYLIRSTAGMVFQNPDDQLVASLVEDDVAFGPENLGVEPAEIAERVTHSLAEVGLMGFEKHETHALSGGQKQRVAIAGVLAMEPKILILDEASSMLDPRGRKGLMRVCRELHEAGLTIVMITHFMEEAAEADRVIVLEEGRVALEGTPDEVLVRTDVLARLNLEVPFACDFSVKLQELGVDVVPCVHESALIAQLREAAPAAFPCAGGYTVADGDADAAGDHDAQAAGDGDARVAGGDAVENAGHADASAVCAVAPIKLPPLPRTSTAEGTPLIEFDHVSYTYDAAMAKRQQKAAKRGKAVTNVQAERAKWGNDPDELWAVRDVSFSVMEGEFLGIAGHTGSGKSTLIQHMNALVRPTMGRVLVGGQDISDKAAATQARSLVGVVFQYPEHQLFAATVFDDVAFGPRNMGLSEDEVRTRVEESLAQVGLDFDEVQEKSPFELSGGQQRRVAFAGVLAMRPRVLVLDEPAAGLDPAARRDFLGMISDLHKRGLTVVMVSHSMDDLARLTDRVLIMKEGEMFCVGTPAEVFIHADELNAIGLGQPCPQRMAGKLRDAGMPLDVSVLYDEALLAHEVAKRITAAGGAAAGSATAGTEPSSQQGEGGAR